MAEAFLAEIRIFAGNFAPQGWAFCDGQLLPVAQNTAVFALVGTTYGGDGQTTLGLPNLQGRAPMHPGNGPGLSPRNLGQTGGSTTETLQTNQVPQHNHDLIAVNNPGDTSAPNGAYLAASPENSYERPGDVTPMASGSLSTTGGQAHNNMQPFLVLNFIFALSGIFPTKK